MSVVAAAASHSELNRRVLLGWIRHCEETGEPMPSDEAIAGRFMFATVEQARTLLADLVDRGEIGITRRGDEREIELRGRAAVQPSKLGSVRPIRSVTNPRRHKRLQPLSADEGFDRIKAILADKRAGNESKPTLRIAEPEIAGREPATRPAERETAPPQLPAPPTRSGARGPVPKYLRVKQVNIRLADADLEAFEAALGPGEAVMAAGKRLLLKGLRAPPKPRIKAHVAAAAVEGGHDLHEFLSLLVELGFREWAKQREAVGR